MDIFGSRILSWEFLASEFFVRILGSVILFVKFFRPSNFFVGILAPVIFLWEFSTLGNSWEFLAPEIVFV